MRSRRRRHLCILPKKTKTEGKRVQRRRNRFDDVWSWNRDGCRKSGKLPLHPSTSQMTAKKSESTKNLKFSKTK
ncbi:Protein CBG26153 [Caenorhabditis briggsae]|uniref:Protein CBG26153 n=1 Tax=Caenorhabditis briggsae TaxID=6238 RepID=B6IIS7_CAEBR|nr:Protein CBG26153 [Caenorhabditis briggsae]CAR99807.1 Protein CBG26153 [Caenorhabditis briggsae]